MSATAEAIEGLANAAEKNVSRIAGLIPEVATAGIESTAKAAGTSWRRKAASARLARAAEGMGSGAVIEMGGDVAQGLGGFFKGAGGAVWNDLKNVEGRSNYLGYAIKGAMIGGGIGGTTEWAQGGDFWEGAKGGAIKGGMAGAGYAALGSIGRATAPSEPKISKQLEAVWKNAKAAGTVTMNNFSKKR
jgi:hypothetical protein